MVFPHDQESKITSPDLASETFIPKEDKLPELSTANFHLFFFNHPMNKVIFSRV